MGNKRLEDGIRYIKSEADPLIRRLGDYSSLEPSKELEEGYESLVTYIENMRKAFPDSIKELDMFQGPLEKAFEAYQENLNLHDGTEFVPEVVAKEKDGVSATDYSGSGLKSGPSSNDSYEPKSARKLGFRKRHPWLTRTAVGLSVAGVIFGGTYLLSLRGDKPKLEVSIEELVKGARDCKNKPVDGAGDLRYFCGEDGLYHKEEVSEVFGPIQEEAGCKMVLVRHPFDSKEIIEGEEGLKQFVGKYKDFYIFASASVDGSDVYNSGLSERRADNTDDVSESYNASINVKGKKGLGEKTQFGKGLRDNRVSVVANMDVDVSKLGGHPDGLYGVEFDCDDAVIHKVPKKKDHISKAGKKCDELVKKVDDLEEKLKKCEERECPQPPQTPQPPPQPPQVPIEPEDTRDKINYPEFYEGEEKVEEVGVVGKELEVKDTDVGPVDFEYRIEENEVPSVKVLRNKDTVSDNSLELKIYNVNNNEVFDTLRLDKRETIDLDDGRVQDTYKGKEKLILPDVDKEGNRTKHEADIEVNVDKVDEQSKLEGIIDSAKNYVIGTAHASGGFGGNLPFAKIIKKKGVEIKEVWVHCIDGIDNDLDGKIDHPADPGCTSALDNNEIDPDEPTAGGVVECKPSDWECTDWSPCVDSQRNRTCTTITTCEGDTGKPDEKDSCGILNGILNKVTAKASVIQGGYGRVNESDGDKVSYDGDTIGMGGVLGYNAQDNLNLRVFMKDLQTKAGIETLAGDGSYNDKALVIGGGFDYVFGDKKKTLVSLETGFEDRKAKQEYNFVDVKADVNTESVILDMLLENRNLFIDGENIDLGLKASVLQRFADMKQDVISMGVTLPGESKELTYGIYKAGITIDSNMIKIDSGYIHRIFPDVQTESDLIGQGVFGRFRIGDNTHLILEGEMPFGDDLKTTQYSLLFGQDEFKIGDMKLKLPGWELGLWKFDQELLTETDTLTKDDLRFLFSIKWNLKDDSRRFWDSLLEFN